MRTHDLKCRPEFFDAIWTGAKTFEVRLDDRGIEVGHLLELREWDPETAAYTGRCDYRTVTYRLPIEDAPGFPPITAPPSLPEIHGAEWVVLGLAPPAPVPPVPGPVFTDAGLVIPGASGEPIDTIPGQCEHHPWAHGWSGCDTCVPLVPAPAPQPEGDGQP